MQWLAMVVLLAATCVRLVSVEGSPCSFFGPLPAPVWEASTEVTAGTVLAARVRAWRAPSPAKRLRALLASMPRAGQAQLEYTPTLLPRIALDSERRVARVSRYQVLNVIRC